jgi:hypothetical protein
VGGPSFLHDSVSKQTAKMQNVLTGFLAIVTPFPPGTPRRRPCFYQILIMRFARELNV